MIPAGQRTADEIMLSLRRRGLSYHVIAVVGQELYGWRLTGEHVRQHLRSLGVAADPSRARSQAVIR